MTQDPIFDTAHGALVFALNFALQNYDRPAMLKMAAPALGTGKGLAGIDGAAQAGMIRAELRAVGHLAEAIIIARLAPATVPCHCRAPCCSGFRLNAEWSEAIHALADYIGHAGIVGATAYPLRRDIVIRTFAHKGHRLSLDEIASRHNASRNTVQTHASAAARLFGGIRAATGRAATPGLEECAFAAVEERLKAAGIVETRAASRPEPVPAAACAGV
jgi:hypothetical protein